MNMKLIARTCAAFFKLCGEHAPLSVLCAPREFQRNSRAKTQAAARVDALRSFLYDESVGRLAQLVRAPALQAGGRRFEPCTAHHPCAPPFRGDVVQLVRTLPSRWLESHTVTAKPQNLLGDGVVGTSLYRFLLRFRLRWVTSGTSVGTSTRSDGSGALTCRLEWR